MLGKKRSRYPTKKRPSKYPKVQAMGTLSASRGFRDRYGYNKNSLYKERKFYDVNTNVVQIFSATGNFTLLFAPGLGQDYNQRIGRKCVARSLYIRGRVLVSDANPIVTAAVGAQQARMIIFMDNQPNGTAPVIGDLLNGTDPSSHLNQNNRDRFKIIKDKYFDLDAFIYNNATGTGAINRTQHSIKSYKKLKCEVIFNQNPNAVIASISTCAIWMFWVCNINLAAEYVISTRIRYDDS